MKKLEKEELLKVIGILAEAEGYDLLTMNKYGSNPSSIAVLCGETGVEYAPVDMDAVVGEYTAGKMDIADIYKSLKNELPSDLQLKFPERQMREYQQPQQQTQYRQPVKPAGPVCAPHCGAHRGQMGDLEGPAGAGRLLPLLPGAGRHP